ncbi:MAG: PQQ-binding-like beta-propeller repeat protein [Candidatus Hydrogenedentes bacterium]|nr:PQQ-binding-like beta-propeller repeat protein [Candidatus Hydrogenedentota bacterium]
MLSFRYLNMLNVFILMALLSVVAQGEEPRPAMPLLAAPINATWAANHAEEWRERGFRGFLFEGILDDLRLFPSELEKMRRESLTGGMEDNTAPLRSERDYAAEGFTGNEMLVPVHWNELGREINGACNRLRAAGVDRNFLRIALAPEDAWFTDAALMAVAEQRFRLAGQFCSEANLRGIAIDTQNSSLIYDYLWDGYSPETSPESLAEGAYTFGLRVLRAFIRHFPAGEIILITGDVSLSRPLWFDMIEGALDAPGAASGIQVSLALFDSPDIRSRTHYRQYPSILARLLSKRSSRGTKENAITARDVLFSLEPVYYEGDIPTARYLLEAYRVALYASALYAGDYVLIRAPQGGWWQIPPDIVEQFQHLKQGGRARVQFAPPVPRTLDAYSPRLLYADAVNIGSLTIDGRDAEVLKGEGGAALLVWEGTSKEMSLAGRTNMISATHLVTGETEHFLPRDGTIRIPVLSGPVLIDGMPLNAYALPAAMRLGLQSPLLGGVSLAELSFGIRNPLAAPLRGSIALVTDAHYALGETTFSLNLAPGEEAFYSRTLRGISSYGARPQFQINLAIAADPVITRNYAVTTTPETYFSDWLDGPMPVSPVFLRQKETNDSHLLFWCDSRGRLTCFDVRSGKSLWHRRLAGSYSQAPVLVEDDKGNVSIGVVSDQGRLRLYDLQGKEKLALWSEERRIHIVAALPAGPPHLGSMLLTGDEGNRVSIYDTRGQLVRRIALSTSMTCLLTTRMCPNTFFVALNLSSDGVPKHDKDKPVSSTAEQACRVEAVDIEGRILWEKELTRSLSCPPSFIEEPDGGRILLCLGDVDGRIICLDARDGAVVGEWKANDGSVRHLAGAGAGGDACSWVFFISGEHLYAQPVAGDSFQGKVSEPWRIAVSQPTALSALPAGEGVAIGSAGGAIYALNASGALMWEDHGGMGAISSLAVLEGESGSGAYRCVAGDMGHGIRGLNVRRDLLPDAPLRLDRLEPPQ